MTVDQVDQDLHDMRAIQGMLIGTTLSAILFWGPLYLIVTNL